MFGDGTTVTPKGSGDTICGRVRLGVHLANAALMHRGLELDRRGLPADGAVLVARMLRCFLRAHFRRARSSSTRARGRLRLSGELECARLDEASARRHPHDDLPTERGLDRINAHQFNR